MLLRIMRRYLLLPSTNGESLVFDMYNSNFLAHQCWSNFNAKVCWGKNCESCLRVNVVGREFPILRRMLKHSIAWIIWAT
jgi:hypothetical protein